MKVIKIFSVTLLFISATIVKADEYPWEKYGFKFKVITLSNGKYQEFHDLTNVVEIGSVLYNTQTKQIVGFVEKDTLINSVDFTPHIVSRWMSPDPLSEEYSSWSPYNYVMDNPVIFIDPDGREVWKSIKNHANGTRIVTLNFDIRVNNSGGFASKDVARWSGAIASQIESSFSGQGGDGKTTYVAKVNMDLTNDNPDNNYTMDFVEVVMDGNTKTESWGRMDGEFGNTKENNMQIKAPGTTNPTRDNPTEETVGRSGAHEVGHTGDLYHPRSSKNTLKGVDVQGNLMHQSWNPKAGKDLKNVQLDAFSENVQEGKPVTAPSREKLGL